MKNVFRFLGLLVKYRLLTIRAQIDCLAVSTDIGRQECIYIYHINKKDLCRPFLISMVFFLQLDLNIEIHESGWLSSLPLRQLSLLSLRFLFVKSASRQSIYVKKRVAVTTHTYTQYIYIFSPLVSLLNISFP